MAFFLPATETFGDRLSKSLLSATDKIAEAYKQKQSTKRDQQIIDSLNDPTLTEMQKIQRAAQLSPEKAKILTDVYAGVLKEQEKGKAKVETKKAEAQAYREGLKDFFPNQFRGEDVPEQPPDSGSPLNQAPVSTANITAAPNEPTPTQIRGQQGVSMGSQSASAPGMAPSQPMQPNLTQEQLDILSSDPVYGKSFANLAASQREKSKLSQKEKEFGHKETTKYATDLRESYDKALEIKKAVKSIRESQKKGSPWKTAKKVAYATLQKNENPLAQLFVDPDLQTLITARKAMAGGFTELMGSRPTQKEFFWYEELIPGILKSVSSNEKSMEYFEKMADFSIKKQEAADEIIKANGGYRPLDLDSKVREKLKPQIDKLVDEGFKVAKDVLPDLEMPFKSLNVYDSSGNLVGTVSEEEANQLPQGYSVK